MDGVRVVCSFVMLLCLTAVAFSNLSAVWQHNDRLDSMINTAVAL
jgi:hypothetical protein